MSASSYPPLPTMTPVSAPQMGEAMGIVTSRATGFAEIPSCK